MRQHTPKENRVKTNEKGNRGNSLIMWMYCALRVFFLRIRVKGITPQPSFLSSPHYNLGSSVPPPSTPIAPHQDLSLTPHLTFHSSMFSYIRSLFFLIYNIPPSSVPYTTHNNTPLSLSLPLISSTILSILSYVFSIPFIYKIPPNCPKVSEESSTLSHPLFCYRIYPYSLNIVVISLLLIRPPSSPSLLSSQHQEPYYQYHPLNKPTNRLRIVYITFNPTEYPYKPHLASYRPLTPRQTT